MKLRKAERQDVIEAEARIDSEFHKLPFPDLDHARSKWHLVTAFEDALRNALWMIARNPRVEEIDDALLRFNLHLDRAKYALRYGLERIYREQPLTLATSSKPDVIPTAYESAAKFLQIGDDFLLASRAFASYYAGNAVASTNSRGDILVLTPPDDAITYSALDILLEGKQDVGTPLSALIKAFMWPELPGLQIQEIVAGTRANGQRIEYHFNAFVCNQLMASIPKPPTIVPTNWVFPWGNSVDVHKVFEGLHARCLFHLLAIHFGSIRFGIRGYGMADVCPMFVRDQLISELSEITGVKRESVSAIIDALSYGTSTDTPDPALQPAIRVSDTLLLVPTLLILSSNFPRNLLALHARVGSRSFDGQSQLFEAGMSDRVEQAVQLRFTRFWMHKYLPKRKDVGEVDLLVADESSKMILLGELRWLLSPGDPREVNNRKKVCEEKVFQLMKKVEAARGVIDPVLKSLGITNDPRSWKVVGAVIVEGCVAAGPEAETLPIVPLRIFELGLNRCDGLKNLHRWLASHVWLPQRNTHFISGRVAVKFGSQRLHWSGLNVLHQQQYFPGYVAKTAARFNESPTEPQE